MLISVSFLPEVPTRAPRPNFLKAPVLDASGKTTSKTGTHPNSSTKIRQQRNMFQMKKQGKNLQDQRNEEEIGNLYEKTQSNDSKEDPESWKYNRGMDKENKC